MSDYDKQAKEFLERNKLQMTITEVPYTEPIWEDIIYLEPRYKYRVAIYSPMKLEYDATPSCQRRILFNFWGSVSDAKRGLKPSSYDVLASIIGDADCPDTFEEFCEGYGYDEDSRKAKKTFRLANAFAKKLRKFFREEEITELQEIQ